MPMNCVINAAMDLCAMSSIGSEEDLAELLGTIQAQFDVADQCGDDDKLQVLGELEHALALAADDAQAALAEARTGFPVSGGSVARWIRYRCGYDAGER